VGEADKTCKICKNILKDTYKNFEIEKEAKN
jgi:hypothetical protein